MASFSLASRPSPAGGLRPALTPAAGDAQTQRAGIRHNTKIHKFQVSTVSGDCRPPPPDPPTPRSASRAPPPTTQHPPAHPEPPTTPAAPTRNPLPHKASAHQSYPHAHHGLRQFRVQNFQAVL